MAETRRDDAGLFIRQNKRKRQRRPTVVQTKRVKTEPAVVVQPPLPPPTDLVPDLSQLMNMARTTLLLQNLQVQLAVQQFQTNMQEQAQMEAQRRLEAEETNKKTRALLDDLLTKCVRIEKIYK